MYKGDVSTGTLKLQNLSTAITDKNPASSENVLKGHKSLDAFFDLAGKLI